MIAWLRIYIDHDVMHGATFPVYDFQKFLTHPFAELCCVIVIEFMLNPSENGTYLMHAIWRLSNLQNVLQLERPLFSLKPVGTRISQCDRPTWLGQLSEDFFSLPWEEFVLEHNRHHASTVDLLIQGEFGWDPEEFHYALQQWAGPFSTNWSSGHSFSSKYSKWFFLRLKVLEFAKDVPDPRLLPPLLLPRPPPRQLFSASPFCAQTVWQSFQLSRPCSARPLWQARSNS